MLRADYILSAARIKAHLVESRISCDRKCMLQLSYLESQSLATFNRNEKLGISAKERVEANREHQTCPSVMSFNKANDAILKEVNDAINRLPMARTEAPAAPFEVINETTVR